MNRKLTVALVGMFVALCFSNAYAIPAYARKYKTSCNTCHVVFPKLNDFGESFRLNGFKIPPDDELYVKREPVKLGADAQRKEWPNSVLPASIPGEIPLALWVRWGFTQTEADEQKFDFGQPTVTWAAGANIGDYASIFAEIGAKQRVYMKFDDFLNNPALGNWLPERSLDLRVGLFEPEIVAFSDARRIPLTEHAAYNANYRFSSGNSNPFKLDRQIGAELMGVIQKRFRYAAGIVNGSNDGNDNNSKKDVYLRVAYKMWGTAFTGMEEVKEGELPTPGWSDNSVTVGLFGYNGNNTVPNAVAVGQTYDIEFGRAGVDVRLNWKNFDILFAFIGGKDKNAGNDRTDIGVNSSLLEIDYMFFPWLMGYGKHESIDFRGPLSSDLDGQEVRRIVIGCTMAIYPNVRVSVEWVEQEDLNDIERDDLLLFRLDTAF